MCQNTKLTIKKIATFFLCNAKYFLTRIENRLYYAQDGIRLNSNLAQDFLSCLQQQTLNKCWEVKNDGTECNAETNVGF